MPGSRDRIPYFMSVVCVCVRLCVCVCVCVISGFCDELLIRSEEYYHVCDSVCDLGTSTIMRPRF
jgi:hypothetical protein